MSKELATYTSPIPAFVSEDYKEWYPGQTYFWLTNPNIVSAEFKFMVNSREQKEHHRQESRRQ